jgi:hypothetical protein
VLTGYKMISPLPCRRLNGPVRSASTAQLSGSFLIGPVSPITTIQS